MGDTVAVQPPTRVPGVVWGLRVNAAGIAVVIVAQPLWIGLLFTGDIFGAMAHAIGASAAVLLALVHIGLAIYQWRTGGGSTAISLSLQMLGALIVQSALGAFHLYPLHLPVGVLMAIGAVSMVKDAWAPGEGAQS